MDENYDVIVLGTGLKVPYGMNKLTSFYSTDIARTIVHDHITIIIIIMVIFMCYF